MTTSVFYCEMEKRKVFETIEEMNEYIKAVRYFYADKLNETDRLLIDYISQHAVKFLGVFGQKWANIAATIGKGVSTIRTSAAKLERLGIIKRHAYIRPKSGGNGSNIITFVKDAVKYSRPEPAEEVVDETSEISDEQANNHANKHPESDTRGDCENADAARDSVDFSEGKALNSFNALEKSLIDLLKRYFTYNASEINNSVINLNSIRNKLAEEVIEVGPKYVHYEIPELFVRAVIPFSRDPKEINKAWSKVKIAYKNSGLDELGFYLEDLIADEERFEELTKRTRSVVGGFVTGKVNDFFAVLYTSILRLFNEITEELAQQQRKEVANTSDSFGGFTFYNWLRKDAF